MYDYIKVGRMYEVGQWGRNPNVWLHDSDHSKLADAKQRVEELNVLLKEQEERGVYNHDTRFKMGDLYYGWRLRDVPAAYLIKFAKKAPHYSPIRKYVAENIMALEEEARQQKWLRVKSSVRRLKDSIKNLFTI